MSDTRYELRYYRSLPLEGLCSPLLDRIYDLPPRNAETVERLTESIQVNGMRNPLTVEWFAPDPSREVNWYIRIGNQRAAALILMGESHAACLFIVPEGVEGPAYTAPYEVLSVDAALALFSADHPWWHSYILRTFRPDLVPPAA